MRGFFGIGIESVSKSMNVGSLFRSAHAFGASFIFTVNAQYDVQKGNKADTSDSPDHVPYYSFPNSQSLILPAGCELIGIELLDDAIDLPSFRHPHQAAYILGPERGNLSQTVLERCNYTVKIPTKFCLNVGLAGAIAMYDRMITLGRFSERPVSSGRPEKELSKHTFGSPKQRDRMIAFRKPSPGTELKNYLTAVEEND